MTDELKNALLLALQAGRATPEERRRILDSVKTESRPREKLLTTRAAATILECHPKTVFRYRAAGLLKCVRRSKRCIRWRQSEVEQLAMEGAVK